MLPDGIRRFFRLGRVKDIEAEVDAELAFHIETKTQALVASGMGPEAARVEALRQFGDVRAARAELLRVETHETATLARRDWWGDWWMDTRQALRGIGRTPGVTASVLLMLGFGIGGASAMFGLLDRILLQVGPGIASPKELQRVFVNEYSAWRKERIFTSGFNEPELRVFAKALPHGYAIASMVNWRDRLGGRSGPFVPLAFTSGDAFRVLGTRPALGRLLEPSDDNLSAEPVAVISYGLWHRSFGGTRDVLGKTLVLGSTHYAIAGVAPEGFSGLQPDRVDAWVPMTIGAAAHYGPHWGPSLRAFPVVIRVPRGVESRTFLPAMQRAYRAYASMAWRDSTAIVTSGSIVPYKQPGPSSDSITLSFIVAGVAVLLCCIAVANVTNLLLLRAVGRERETAVRMALGAGRARLIRSVVVESVMLGVLGAALAGVVAALGGELLRKLIVQREFQESLFNSRVLVFAGCLGLVVGLMTGLVPGWQASRPGTIAALKAGVRAGSPRSRLRSGLVVLQAALTVVLMAGLGLFVQSFLRARGTDYGLLTDRLINIVVQERADSLAPPGRVAQVAAELANRVRLLPGVAGVSQTSMSPIFGYSGELLRAEGGDTVRLDRHGPFITEIDSAFLPVSGLRILRGRAFSAAEVATRAPVALVNAAFVQRVWPGQEPLGKCLFVGFATKTQVPQCRLVVGVVSNYISYLQEDAPTQAYYLPLGYRWDENLRGSHMLLVRTSTPPQTVVPGIVRMLQQRLPDAEPQAVKALADIVAQDRDSWRSGTMLFGLFAGLAIALAMGGLYSIVAFGVSQRTHEFGIRIAVGARAVDIAILVAVSALRPLAVGLTVGLLLALWLSRFVASLLYNTTPHDPVALAGACAFLIFTAVVACATPVRSAIGTDPRQALQAE